MPTNQTLRTHLSPTKLEHIYKPTKGTRMLRGLLRVNMSKAAGPNNISGHLLKNTLQSASGCYWTVQTYNCHKREFPPASVQPPSYLYLKHLQHQSEWLLPCGTQHCSEEELWKTGFPAHPEQHHSQPGPSPVCIQNQQIQGDAILTALYSAFTHLEGNNTNTRMLFVDFSSSLNTICLMTVIG